MASQDEQGKPLGTRVVSADVQMVTESGATVQTTEHFPAPRIWQLLNLLAVLISAFATLYSGFYVPSPFTTKKLQSTIPFSSDITGTLSGLGDSAQVSIIIDHSPVQNLVLSILGVSNIGSVAIIPSEFYEPLSINVDKQWKILLVKNIAGADHPVWKKVNDQKFEASPELMNPGDLIWVSVYTTNTKYEHLTNAQISSFTPSWAAHILNLPAITPQVNYFAEAVAQIKADPFSRMVPIYVSLQGSSLVITLSGMVLFMTVYIHLLYYLGIIVRHRWQSVSAIIGVSIISLTSSEATATYLLPNIVYRMQGINNWLNMPWIVLNFVVLVGLSWKAWRKTRAAPPLSSI